MPEMWRLFVAIELPPELVVRLREIQDGLKRQVPRRTLRWVDPAGIHLTLKFLGDVPSAQRETLQNALDQAAQKHREFELTAQGLGCFPNPRRPRVVWAGIQPGGSALQALRDTLETLIAPLGYPTEDRPFSPHLTLGRVRQEASREDAQKLGNLVAAAPTSTIHQWRVNRVSLIRSELKPGGAVYSVLHHVGLRPSGPA
jgi:2'-5' RNA ligase